MQKLSIENFSCIKHAEIDFSRLTLLIGPQASGKSVICKLAYFFMNLAQSQEEHIRKGSDNPKFQSFVKRQFLEWFPPDAWGCEAFKIEFSSGLYKVNVSRSSYGKKLRSDIRIRLSQEFKDQYDILFDLYKKGPDESADTAAELRASWDHDWQLLNSSRKSLAKLMGTDYYAGQVFVPAGRSFFTSLDKAISIFEHARTIDPLIMQFGKLYNIYRERRFVYRAGNKHQRDQLQARLQELFGGTVERDEDIEYIRTTDGRKVRLSALSSGQQEIFPLLTTIPVVAGRDESTLCYIEEPEAHLFPKSQSLLVEALTLLLAGGSKTSPHGLVLTTHSPYVLAKINNLIKAGALGRRNSEMSKRVDSVIPRRFWLSSRSIRAYAIEDGVVRSIIGDDNFIDADYLDDISNDIAEEFGRLLEIEANND